MLEKQQKTLDMLVMAQQTTNERLDSLEKTQSKMERNIAGINRSIIDMDDRLDKAESIISVMTDSITKYGHKYADLYALVVSVDIKVDKIEDAVEELAEHSEINRSGINKILDWAERVEKSTLTTISIPPLTAIE